MRITSAAKAQKIIKYPGGLFGLTMALRNAPRNMLFFPMGWGNAIRNSDGKWDYEFELEVEDGM